MSNSKNDVKCIYFGDELVSTIEALFPKLTFSKAVRILVDESLQVRIKGKVNEIPALHKLLIEQEKANTDLRKMIENQAEIIKNQNQLMLQIERNRLYVVANNNRGNNITEDIIKAGQNDLIED